MSRFLLKLLVSLLICITSLSFPPPKSSADISVIQGNTYYVSVNGSDSNKGDIDRPWRTIQTAANRLRAGDTVYIRSGVYKEAVLVKNSGTLQKFITFAAYPGETVTIDGAGINTYYDGLFSFNGNDYIVLDGIRAINADWLGIGDLYGSSHHIIVRNCSTYNTVTGGIGFSKCSYITITSCKIEKACTGNYNAALYLGRSSNFEVSYNRVYNSGRESIDILNGCNHGKVHDNICVGSSLNNLSENRPAIYLDGYSKIQTDIKVYNNICHDCPMGIAIACEDGGSLQNIKIYNNYSYNNLKWGITVGIWGTNPGYIKDVYIYNNTTYNNGNGIGDGGGIYLQAKAGLIRNVVVTNNICAEFKSSPKYTPIYSCMNRNLKAYGYIVDNNLLQKAGGNNRYLGTNAKIAAPMFIDPKGCNFSLQPKSPAIGSGKNYWTGAVCNMGASPK